MTYKIYPGDGIPRLVSAYAREKHHTLFGCRPWQPHVYLTDEEHPQHEYMPSELQMAKKHVVWCLERMMAVK